MTKARVITRCGNFYGGGDLNWNRIVPGTIRSVLRGQSPIIRSDSRYVRDYFYIEDGAAAYMLLAERLAADRELTGEAFNFSNGLQVSVLELVQRILSLMGSNLEPDVRNEASNEIWHQYLSAAKAREKLGWSPLFTLEEGLRKTIDWYQEYFSLMTNDADALRARIDEVVTAAAGFPTDGEPNYSERASAGLRGRLSET